jgi:hypothetical protein
MAAFANGGLNSSGSFMVVILSLVLRWARGGLEVNGLRVGLREVLMLMRFTSFLPRFVFSWRFCSWTALGIDQVMGCGS